MPQATADIYDEADRLDVLPAVVDEWVKRKAQVQILESVEEELRSMN